MPPLPPELVDLIISSLHPIPLKRGNGDGNFLDGSAARVVGKFALICRAWVPSSRRVLFYRVHIRNATAYKFAKLFYRAQRLTFLPFIRELVFVHGIAEHRWMNTVFPRIAKHLPSSIHTLVLAVRHKLVHGLPCPPLRSTTCLEIVTQFTSIATAEVVACLASFPALEEAKIWLADSSGNDMRLPPTTLGVAESLRSLDLKCSAGIEPLLTWIQTTGPAISTLALSFTRRPEAHKSIKYSLQYIESLGPSLTSLSIAVDDFFSTDDFYPEFPRGFLTRNTRLRALAIHASPTQSMMLLGKTHFAPPLHSVTIWVPATLLGVFRPSTYVEPVPWDALDALLAPLSVVDRVHVVFFGNVFVTRRLELDAQPRYLGSKLPLCVARGVVSQGVVHQQVTYFHGWNV
ncbi:hypothetical protein FB451DRAFT_1228026 [Mycena latifolia]|nr:hypothetical protein FB451DRAFT_1228026 [Mycena latifolia]